jgi:hypothetical protein
MLAKSFIVVSSMLLVLSAARVCPGQEQAGSLSVTLSAGDLQAVFAGNGEFPGHRAGYNGVVFLRHRADSTTLFMPPAAGLNLEHIYDGQKWWEPREALFEPRTSPMEIERIAPDTVLLHQPPTSLHKLESWTRFTVTAPNYVDMEFTCIPRAETFDRGYLGLFWASYINTAVGKEYYFIGRRKGEEKNRWIAFISPEHNVNSTVRWVDDTRNPTFSENYPPRLFNNYFDYGYSYPFYYGRRGGMVYILMFDQTGPVRFSHSPSSGGPVSPGTYPAWDFQYLIYGCRVGQQYGFKARLVYKPYVDGEDIIREYEQWSGRKVELE